VISSADAIVGHLFAVPRDDAARLAEERMLLGARRSRGTMRVVHLTTEFPWPATSGGPRPRSARAVRTLSQLRLLSSLPEIDTITLVSVADRPVRQSELDALAAAVPKVRPLRPVFHPIHLWQSPRYVARVAALRALGVPYLAAKWASRLLRETLLRELERAPTDVVYVDHLGMVCNLRDIEPKCAPAHTVLDQHNVESDIYGQVATARRGAKKMVAAAEHRAAERFERNALQSVDAVIASSVEDAQRFEEIAGVSAHVVPAVLETSRRARPARAPRATPRFCWVGNLRWLPNVAGLDWFCREVWPRIRARLPGATFEIAGAGAPADAAPPTVPDSWNQPGVQTVGALEDLEPLCERSVAMLAPVVGGSATRTKLLEGFSAGLPVVTTSDGASGLSVKNGRELLIASAPDAFADHVVRLASDEPLRERLAAAGHAYLERRHSLEVAQRAMRAAIGANRGEMCTR
jgi:glycosyltransferase involved in cell wall biosynthesis